MRSRMPIYYDEENNIRLHFSANQTHEIIGICEKCWNKEPKG